MGAERWIKGVVFSAELPLTSLPSILPLFISCFLLSFDPLTLPEDSSCCWRRERGKKGRRWWWKRLRMPGLSELPPSCCFPCFPIIQHFILILLYMFGQVFPCSDVKHTAVKAHHLPETQFCHLISFNLLFSNNLRLDDKNPLFSVLIFYFLFDLPGWFLCEMLP